MKNIKHVVIAVTIIIIIIFFFRFIKNSAKELGPTIMNL